jgi:hypothetical protein
MNQLLHKPNTASLETVNNIGVEYFHIYSDEKIERRHQVGLDHLKSLEQSWNFEYDKIILIDNYNPVEEITTACAVLEYLADHGALPDYWAYEKDMVVNATLLLESIESPKLKRSYEKYILNHNKYPCSLLTASWYLTRLGKLPFEEIISSTKKDHKESFKPSVRLVNILPTGYKPIEERARKIILKSPHKSEVNNIQNLFYLTGSERSLELF